MDSIDTIHERPVRFFRCALQMNHLGTDIVEYQNDSIGEAELFSRYTARDEFEIRGGKHFSADAQSASICYGSIHLRLLNHDEVKSTIHSNSLRSTQYSRSTKHRAGRRISLCDSRENEMLLRGLETGHPTETSDQSDLFLSDPSIG